VKVRKCQAFIAGQPLTLQFPDKFAGVVMVLECNVGEASQLLAQFDGELTADVGTLPGDTFLEPPPTKFSSGSRVQMLGRKDEKITYGWVVGVNQKDPKGTLYNVSYTDSGGNPSVMWMPERYLREAPPDERRDVASDLIGKRVEYIGPQDEFKGERGVIEATTPWNSDEPIRHYIKFSGVFYGWFSEAALRLVGPDEPDPRGPNAWRIGNRVRCKGWKNIGEVKAIELDGGLLLLRVVQDGIDKVSTVLWPADDCVKVLS
jgi:hypothetical protein